MEKDPITKAQIKAIWAVARSIGFSREDLYELVPRGSIRGLTKQEASDLIDRLGRKNPSPSESRRRLWPHHYPIPKNVIPLATPQQRAYIRYLFNVVLGWEGQPHRTNAFTSKILGISDPERINRLKDATKLIIALERFIVWLKEQSKSSPVAESGRV